MSGRLSVLIVVERVRCSSVLPGTWQRLSAREVRLLMVVGKRIRRTLMEGYLMLGERVWCSSLLLGMWWRLSYGEGWLLLGEKVWCSSVLLGMWWRLSVAEARSLLVENALVIFLMSSWSLQDLYMGLIHATQMSRIMPRYHTRNPNVTHAIQMADMASK